MRQELAVLFSLMAAAALIYSYAPIQEATPIHPQEDIRINTVDYLRYHAETCTEVTEIECAVDVERTVIACAKAFETEGADIIADIKCAKDLLGDKKHCWPCICAMAKKKGWHIVGC